MNKDMPPPRGITIEEAARMLRYSRETISRMINDGTLAAWKPHGKRGRKWLIDEIHLAAFQSALIEQARSDAAPVQSALLNAARRR